VSAAPPIWSAADGPCGADGQCDGIRDGEEYQRWHECVQGGQHRAGPSRSVPHSSRGWSRMWPPPVSRTTSAIATAATVTASAIRPGSGQGLRFFGSIMLCPTFAPRSGAAGQVRPVYGQHHGDRRYGLTCGFVKVLG